MTYNPNHDRTYWRACDSARLIEAARDSGHELAIALGERLDAEGGTPAVIDDMEYDLRSLQRENEALRIEIAELEARDGEADY